MDSDTFGESIRNSSLSAVRNDIDVNIANGYRSLDKYYAIGKTTGTQYEETDCPTEDVIAYAYTQSYTEANGGSAVSYGTATWTPHESTLTSTITTAESYNGNHLSNYFIMDLIIDNGFESTYSLTRASIFGSNKTVEVNYNSNSDNLDIQGFYTHGSSDKIIHFISATLTGIDTDGTETDYTSKFRFIVNNSSLSAGIYPNSVKILDDDHLYNTADYFCHKYTRPDCDDESYDNKLNFEILIGNKTFPVGYKFVLKVKYEIATTKAVIS